MHNREITHIVKNRQLLKNSIGCKDQMLFLLPFERNLFQNYKQVFYETTMEKLDLKFLLNTYGNS